VAMAAPAAKKSISVAVCTDVSGLPEAVERAFAASALASTHELKLQALPLDADASREAEILLADPGKVKSVLDSVRGLRWLQSTWAGVNALEGVRRRDFKCTRLAGCFGPQMSEYVLGAVLYEDWRSLAGLQAEGRWDPAPFKRRRRLGAMTMGLLGAGDIAQVIGQRAQAFGMQTLAFATAERQADGFHRITTDLDAVLREADVLVNVLPSTRKTRGLLDGGKLRVCGEGKVLINVGRGDVVSEESLLEALEAGWLRRAVLDVFATEPLPAASRLWSHPAVQLSPHIAAVTYPDDSAAVFVSNLARWVEGKPLSFAVDLDKGY